ncbi:uncharacterized protein ATC70_006850 [Mucor velutinosus]|uniref:Ndc10 domain-containing protein n=1 Tax=Mucor velutinosus TaxID=708070 RepID=A0AAN7DP92_9FUNG|nr:hypothetical protein ATC70_006850 [Mucor velutinosus]
MDRKTHSAAVKDGLLACCISSSKATHLFRGAGARMADAFGVNESQIRRNGRWNSSSINRAYLTGLLRNLMRQLADFPKEIVYSYLPRGTLKLPEELQRVAYHELKEWVDRINSKTAQKTGTVVGFIKLLRSLRTGFLQNSVQMRKPFPDRFIWHHIILGHPLLCKKFSE